MYKEDEEYKKRLEEAQNIISNINSNNNNNNIINSNSFSNQLPQNETDYTTKLKEAESIINSINPTNTSTISDEELLKTEQEKIDKLRESSLTEDIEREQRIAEKMDKLWVDSNTTEVQDKEETQEQEKKGSLLDKALYVGKKVGAGGISGLAGIGQSIVTDAANNFEKGEDKSITDIISDFVNNLTANPANKITKNIPSIIGNAITVLKDENKTPLEKLVSLSMNSITEATNSTSAKQTFDTITQATGKVIPGASEAAMSLNNAISEPIQDMNNNLNEEGSNYDAITQTLGNVGQVVGNMLPSIAVTGITKNPRAGLMTMGLSSKGQSTQEALELGAELDEAVKIGNTKAMVEVGTELLTGGLNIFGKGALDDIVERGIVDKVQNNVTKKLVKMGVDNAGEVLEESISDILGTIIDKGTINPEAEYTIKDWGDTAITTVLSTTVLNVLTGGLAGQINNNRDNKNTETETLNNEDMGTFYTIDTSQEGEIQNIQEVQGKQIENPNTELNINPIIIMNTNNNSYNIIDGNTGIVLDSTPYETIIGAKTGFDKLATNLKKAQVNDINNKVNEANYMISDKLMSRIVEVQDEINNAEIDNQESTTPREYTQEQYRDITNTIGQISDRTLYNNDATINTLETVSNNVKNVNLIEQSGNYYLNSLDENGRVTYQQKITNRPYTGKKIKEIVNNAIQNADTSYIYQEANTDNTQTSTEPNASTFYSNETNYAVQDIKKATEPFDKQKTYSKEEMADIWNDEIADNNYDTYYDKNGNIERYIAIEEDGDNLVVNQYDNNDNIVKSEAIPSENGRYNASDIQDTLSRVASLYDENRPIKGQQDIEGNEVKSMKKNKKETSHATAQQKLSKVLSEKSPNTKITQDRNIVRSIEKFERAKNNIDRETVVNIANSLDIKIKGGAVKIENTNMSKLAGKNKTPSIITIDELFKDLTSKNIKEYRKEAESIANNLYRDKIVKIYDTQTNTEINKSGIEKTLSGNITKSKIQSINKLQDIIEQGIYGYTTYNPNDNNGILYHHFFTPVNYQNKNGLIRVVIREFTNDNSLNDKYYYHQLEFISNKKIEGINALPQINGNKEIKFLPSTKNSITQKTKSVKNNTATNKSMQNNKNNTSNDNNSIRAMKKNTSRNTTSQNNVAVEVDNQGRTLTKQQQEYFKNSKVRDDNGNLLTLYHGSSNQFTIFDQNRAGKSTEDASIGFWFTETREGADKFTRGAWYSNDNSNVYEVYLDIKNPKIYRSIDNSVELEQLDNRLKENNQKLRDIENKNFAIEVNSSDIRWASDESELNDIAKAYGLPNNQISEFVTQAKEYQNLLKKQYNLEKEYENKRYNDAYEQFKNDIYKVAGKTPSDANIGGTGMYIENYSEVVKQYKQNLIDQGYDGIIIEGTRYDSEYFGRNNNQYVAFNSNQIKNVDNINPTSNQDIRFAKKTVKPKGEVIEPGQTNAQRDTNYIEQEIRKIEQTGNWDDSIPVTKMTDIRKTIENYLGLGVQKGHFRQQAYGIYKGNRDVIRTKELKDIDSILHETGHALDIGNRIKLNKENIADELLTAIDRYGGYEAETREVRLEEGFAEVIREYAIVPNQARIDYPQTVAVLEGIRQNDKSFDNFITQVQQQTYNYIHQNPRNREFGNQSVGERTDKPVWSKEYVRQLVIEHAFDSNYSLKRATQVLQQKSGSQKLKASDNAYLLTRLTSGIGDKVTSMLANGYIDENGNKLFPGLNQLGEILDNNAERFNDLRTYLVAQRDLEYKTKFLKTGLRTNDSIAVVNQFKNDSQIQEAAKVVHDTLDGVLQYAVNNKLITEENAKALRDSNAFYVPMHRVIGTNGNNVGRKGAVADIIKARTGSELDIKDVLENVVTNSANIIQQVENNKIINALYTQGENAGLTGSVYDEIDPPMKKVGTARLSMWENELKKQGVDIANIDFDKTMDIFVPNNNIDEKQQIVSFIDNKGQRRYLQFNDEMLFKTLTGLDRDSMSNVLRFCENLNKPLRFGATIGNVAFSIPNMLADTVQASIYSEAGFIPFVDTALGTLDVLSAKNKIVRDFMKKVAPQYAERINRMYELYNQSGSTNATRIGQERKSTQKIMKDIYGTKNSEVLGIPESFKPLKRLADIMTYIPELSEQSTRFRVFEKNLEYYRRNGKAEIDARIEAAIQSRDASQDFSRMGKTMREVNKVIPFSAARVGSVYTFAEKMKANPKRTTARIAIMLALNMAIKGLTSDDDEINELNQRKKDDNFVFKVGDQIITIKKPQGILRSYINLTDYIFDLASGNIEEGKEGERLQQWLFNAIMDNSVADDITGMVPSAITPLLENAINKDLYYNSDIVKSYDLELPNSQQYYDYNSQLAILLGQVFNYSPAKIDNFISGYFAGLGTQVTNIIDWVVSKTGATPEEPDMGLESNSIGKRFFVNVNSNSASVDEIYDLKTELTKKKNGGTITSAETQQLEEITNAISNMSKLNKQIKEIKKDSSMTGQEKAEQIKLLQQEKTDTARQALGKDLIYSNNSSKIQSTQFYPTNSSLSKSGYKLELTSEMKKEYEEIADEYYNKYASQGLYSSEKLEDIKSKAKDYAKNQLFKKYKSSLVRSK